MTSLLGAFDLDWGSTFRRAFTLLGMAGGDVMSSLSVDCLSRVPYDTRA